MQRITPALGRLSRTAGNWLAAGLDLALPPVCCFCRRLCQPVPEHPGICRACLAGLPLRFGIDRQLRLPAAWAYDSRQKGSQVLAAAFYRSPVREALLRLKFSDDPQTSVALGSLLTPLVGQIRPNLLGMAAVPLHPSRQKERGYNQSALLTAQVCRQSRLPDLSAGLARKRETLRQSELADRTARQLNVAGAFCLHSAAWQEQLNVHAAGRTPQAAHVLLIDDVLTTGATLAAAAEPLIRAGFRVSCLVVASDQGRQAGLGPADA